MNRHINFNQPEDLIIPKLIIGDIDPSILCKAITMWGKEAQVEMIKEECLELALAIQKLSRVRGDYKTKYLNVIDEIADVTIMMRQARIVFPDTLIRERIDFKMNRLYERLNETNPT